MAWQVVTYVLLIASAHASCNGCSTGEDGNALLQTKASLSTEKFSQQEDYLQDKALFQTQAGAVPSELRDLHVTFRDAEEKKKRIGDSDEGVSRGWLEVRGVGNCWF